MLIPSQVKLWFAIQLKPTQILILFTNSKWELTIPKLVTTTQLGSSKMEPCNLILLTQKYTEPVLFLMTKITKILLMVVHWIWLLIIEKLVKILGLMSPIKNYLKPIKIFIKKWFLKSWIILITSTGSMKTLLHSKLLHLNGTNLAMLIIPNNI